MSRCHSCQSPTRWEPDLKGQHAGARGSVVGKDRGLLHRQRARHHLHARTHARSLVRHPRLTLSKHHSPSPFSYQTHSKGTQHSTPLHNMPHTFQTSTSHFLARACGNPKPPYECHTGADAEETATCMPYGSRADAEATRQRRDPFTSRRRAKGAALSHSATLSHTFSLNTQPARTCKAGGGAPVGATGRASIRGGGRAAPGDAPKRPAASPAGRGSALIPPADGAGPIAGVDPGCAGHMAAAGVARNRSLRARLLCSTSILPSMSRDGQES